MLSVQLVLGFWCPTSVQLVLCVAPTPCWACGLALRVGAAGAVCRRLRLACGWALGLGLLHAHGALASRLLRCCCCCCWLCSLIPLPS